MTDQMTWEKPSGKLPNYTAMMTMARAAEIVAWVNRLGGEARYYAGPECPSGCWYRGHENVPVIVITGPDGDLIVHPGDTVIDTGEWFDKTYTVTPPPHGVRCRLFRVAAAGAGSDQ